MAHEIERVDEGLVYLALAAGNAKRAHERMGADGLDPIPVRTLNEWKNTVYPERYAAVLAEKEQWRREQGAERLADLSQQTLEAYEEVLQRFRRAVRAGDHVGARDFGGAMKNASAAFATFTDKENVARDRPTSIVDHRSSEDAWRDLAHAFPGLIVEGTAEEVGDPAELPGGDS
jgi:hypothetical protein